MSNPLDVHRGPTYFVWADPSKRVATSTKIANALKRYEDKYGRQPHEILVHESDLETRSPIPLRTERFVNRNTFYLPIPDT